MRNFLITLTFLLFIVTSLKAQQFEISGTLVDSIENESLIGANVMLVHPSDSTDKKIVATDFDGKFKFSGVSAGNYTLIATYIGYSKLTKPVVVEDKSLHLGDIYLSDDAQMMKEFVVRAEIAPSVQKGDTTQFNADAFKTLPDASGQDLVEKMQGINMQDGQLQAQGENIQQILVDGKPFFGNDVNAALQNLPAEVIASIQVFDKKSDKAELTGFDDGERAKTINIVTKPDRRRGQFGKATGGYGSDDRYQVGTSVNFFNNDRRITVSALSNNINILNYSADPNSQARSRTQNGMINTNGLGLNFSDEWENGMELSGSYSFNHRENKGSSYRFREYILPSDSGQTYTENRLSNNINADHRFNMRFEYNISDRSRLLIRPNMSLKNDKNNSYFTGRTITDNGPLNQTENTARSDHDNYDFTNRMYFSHRFAKKGRSLTLRSRLGYHPNIEESYRMADNTFYGEEDRNELLNQKTGYDRIGLTWNAGTSYTEPVGKNGQVELEYSVGNRINDSDKLTYDIHENPDYFRLDTALSNTFESKYLNQEAEFGYQYRTEKFRVQAEVEYEQVDMQNDQHFPLPFNMERTFKSFLPSARFVYKFSDSRNVRIDYRTWNDAPSVGQLQEVINNSNPLHLRTGNSNLDQSVTNRIQIRYRDHHPETERTLFAFVESRFMDNTITNSTFIADRTTEVGNGIILEKGSQLTRPVNVDGYWRVRSYVSYGKPIDFIKSNFNVNTYINYTQRPGMINDEKNFINTSNFRLRLSLSSNISEKVDFNISTSSGYNIVENSLRPRLNTNYFNQSTRLRYNWVFLDGFIYRTDLNHQVNSGLSEGYDNNYLLWNMSLGKKFLKDDLAEVSVNVYDLLAQNNNISRRVSELYIEDRQSAVLQRYFMLSLTYNIRHFSKGSSMDDFEDLL